MTPLNPLNLRAAAAGSGFRLEHPVCFPDLRLKAEDQCGDDADKPAHLRQRGCTYCSDFNTDTHESEHCTHKHLKYPDNIISPHYPELLILLLIINITVHFPPLQPNKRLVFVHLVLFFRFLQTIQKYKHTSNPFSFGVNTRLRRCVAYLVFIL